MSHPDEQVLRSVYAAFARGDLDGHLAFCAEGITFHVAGRGQVTGDYTRAEFKHPFISEGVELTAGTFRETVREVVANERCGVVLARHEFERGGRAHAYDTAHVYKIRDGKLAEFVEYPADPYAFDEAWK